jgi:hypothetical protein
MEAIIDFPQVLLDKIGTREGVYFITGYSLANKKQHKYRVYGIKAGEAGSGGEFEPTLEDINAWRSSTIKRADGEFAPTQGKPIGYVTLKLTLTFNK